MGLCFSRRKPAVTHNASPRSSFSLSCKSDAVAIPLPLRAQKPNDEIAVVASKDSAALSDDMQNSRAPRKIKGLNAMRAPKTENALELPIGDKGLVSPTGVQGVPKATCKHSATAQKMEKDLSKGLKFEVSEDCNLSVDLAHMQATNERVLVEDGAPASAISNVDEQPSFPCKGEHVAESCIPSLPPPPAFIATPAVETDFEDKQVVLAMHGESVTEANATNKLLLSSSVNLKRSRSCEETIMPLPDIKRCCGRRSLQENSVFTQRALQLETKLEPLQFGTTKFLEGLDLVDVLPHRRSFGENQSGALLAAEEDFKPGLFELSHHESHGLQADFFALKNRYLSSCGLLPQNALASNSCPESDDGQLSVYSVNSDGAEDGMMSSFGFIHSKASSLDSAARMDMVQLYSSSCRHPISVVEEVDETECVSDESDTFEFKHLVSIHGGELNLTKVLCRSRLVAEEEETSGPSCCGPDESRDTRLHQQGRGSPRVKELSVVATGDALLYTGSNSEEFDLIPSKAFVRGSPKTVSLQSSDTFPNQVIRYPGQEGHTDDDQEKAQPGSLSVDDIIRLLEKDELDEDVLLSFLNLTKSPATISDFGNMMSSHASDVASEASFEFKIKSSGSTPHSTPSTPMLSAGSTPKRITQLSPLALTPEEIAEIWGVFEQRQVLSLSNV